MKPPDSDLPPAFRGEGERPHKPADDREEIYFEGSPMLRGELGKVLGFGALGLLLILSPFLYRWLFERWPPIWVTLMLLIIGSGVATWPVLLIKSIRYRVSNYRIDFERGILSRRVDTLELWHVDDISLRQSLLDRIFGVGTIMILSNDDSTPRLPLQGVPNPRPVFDALKQRIIAVKRQRGVIKMDMGGST